MVDNTIALQVRPFQMPDVGQIYGQAQNIQLNRMRMAEAQETAQERNALRGLLSSGVDLNTPEGIAQLRRAAPMLAPQYEQAAGQRAYQRAQIERIQSQNDREAFQTAQTLLGTVRNAEDYSVLRPALMARFPQYAQFFRPDYSPELIRNLALGAQSLATSVVQPGGTVYDPVTNAARFTAPERSERPQAVPLAGGGVAFANPSRGTFTLGQEVPIGGQPAAPPVAAPPAASSAQPTAPAAQPAAPAVSGARVPLSQSTDILAMVPGVRRAEGTGQNPRSSAQGNFQFLDPTFIDQFRRNFPDQARGRSDQEILALRGTTLPDGRRVEEVLGPAYMQQNAQALTRGGFAATGQNVYLAHHFGATGAQNLLRAAAGDPNLPVDRVLSEQVLASNPFLRGATVGQVLEWAGNAMDQGPAQARRLLDASRTGGPPTNALAPGAPRNAMQPPRTVSEFIEQRDLRQLDLELAKLRGQNVVRGEERPARVAEAGETAEAQARGRAVAEREERDRERRRGQQQLEGVLSDMVTQYQELRRLGGITSSAEGASLANIPAFVSGTRIGQMGGRAVATPSQTARDQIESLRNQLLQAFKGATGMTGREADSNQDVQRLLAAVSDPTMSIEAVYGILRSFSQRYGLGELNIPETRAPAAAPSRDQTPGPRRGAAAPAAPVANAAPTLEQFLAAARRANPNVSDQALTDYYNRTYGGR
jgi:hypothetical protein